jgi:hypothetical protein
MTQILLIGDSHLGAVKRGYDLHPERYPNISFASLGKGGVATSRFFEVDETGDSVRITAETWNKLEFSRAGQRDKPVPGLLVLSLPLNTSRILRDYSWDTHVPWFLKRDEHEVAISDAFVEGLIDQDSCHTIDYAVALSDLGISIAVLEAPRFFEDAAYLKRCRLDVIQHVDRLYRQRVGQRLAGHGISVIPQPPQTIGDLGTTRMAFDNEKPRDVHHANAAYGQLALDQIQSFATQQLEMLVG